MPPLSTQAVAEALRARLPGVDTLKLHKLLYYCQGYHLASFGERLFNDTVSAFDNGPIIGRFWFAEKNGKPLDPPGRPPDESELNTIGYIVSKYGGRTGSDLKHQTHDEDPYLMADKGRAKGASSRIEESWMKDYFRRAAIRDDPTANQPSPLAATIDAQDRPDPSHEIPDDLDRLRSRIAVLRGRHGR